MRGRRAALAVAAVLAAAMLASPGRAPVGIVLDGAVAGAGTGLLAVGLVLTYRTTRVINFAYGATGALGGGLAAALAEGQRWNWALAAALGVASGVAVGAAVDVLVVRRLADAPRLVLTVATIGSAQVLAGVTARLPGWLGAPATIPRVGTSLGGWDTRVGPVAFTGDDLVLVAAVPAVLAGLSWFLHRSDTGTAVRGVAENRARARLLGIPADRVSLVVWSLAGGLAALAVALAAPGDGVPLAAAAGPTVLLPALAAAVVAGLRSLGDAFAAAVVLGVVDRLVAWNVDRVAPTSVLLLVVVVGALLAQRPWADRPGDPESSWAVVGTSRRLPRAYAALPEVRAARVAVGVLVVGAALALPVLGSGAQVNYGTVTLAYGLVALSLVVLTGWGGVVSLGQVAVMGVGAVVTANLVADHNGDLFVGLVLAAAAGGLVAVVLGVPALRVSGEALAVATLAFAVAMELYVLNPANHGSWLPAAIGRPDLWGTVGLSDERWLYGLALALVAAAVVGVRNLRRTQVGRAVAATRDNGPAAAAAGIDPVRAPLVAFVIAGALAGVAGGVHAVALRGIGQSTYPAATSLLVFSMAAVGGIASVPGALAGVAAGQWAGYLVPEATGTLTGLALVVTLVVAPSGVAARVALVRDRVAFALGRRRGLVAHDALAAVHEPAAPTLPAPPPADTAGRRLNAYEVRRAVRGRHLLRCEGLDASYGRAPALFSVDVDVERHELLALVGTNGSGKSTLLKSLAGLLRPSAGRVTFDGRDITGWPPEEVARLGLTLVPGGHGVFPGLTVAENLRLATWLQRDDPAAAGTGRGEATALFPFLAERAGQRAGSLSGGEQQQLSLAMAFATRPRLLCIDELSLGLAPAVVDRLMGKVRAIHATGTTVVVVEQSIDVAAQLCGRAVFLEKGRVRFRGPTDRLLDRPDILRAAFLGRPRPAPRPATTPRRDRGGHLVASGLTKRFGGIRAVDDVRLDVAPGSAVGLIGHNGAGKTTVFDILTGLQPADAGIVLLDGVDVTDWPPHRRAVAQLGRSFQDARLFASLTVEEAVAVGLDRRLANRDPVAAALGLPASRESEASAATLVRHILDALGLAAEADRPTGELSAGLRRIVELACVLAQDPAVVLLDEPSSGLGQREAEALVPLLAQVRAVTGCSMVIVEHDMAVLAALCDRLVALEQGSVIASGSPADVLADPRVVSSYLGTGAAARPPRARALPW